MFGDERASAKKINLFLIRSALRQQNWGRDWDSVQQFPRQQNWRRTCVHAVAQPPTFANLITIGSLANHHILAQSVNQFLRYGDGVCTCARAEVPHPRLVEST